MITLTIRSALHRFYLLSFLTSLSLSSHADGLSSKNVTLQKPMTQSPAPAQVQQMPPIQAAPPQIKSIPATQSVNPAPAMRQPIPAPVRNPTPQINTAPPQVNRPPVPKPAIHVNRQQPVPTGHPVNPASPPASGANIGRLPSGNRLGNVNPAIINGQQIHGMRDAREAADALRNSAGRIEGVDAMNPKLGLGGSDKAPDFSKLPGHDAGIGFEDPTGRLPAMPGNQGKSKLGGAPIGPSSPREAMGGATGSDARVTKFEDGAVTKTWTTRNQYGDRVQNISSMSPDGTTFESTTTRDSSGVYRVGREESPDGTVVIVRVSTGRNGRGGASSFRRDPDGTVWETDGPVRTGRHGQFIIDWGDTYNATGSRHLPREFTNPASNPDPDNTDPDGRWARYDAKISGNRPDSRVRNPNRVNPGRDSAMSNPQAPRLRIPEDQLVINPDPNNVQGQDTVPDARTAEMLRRQLKSGVGPGPDPIHDPIGSSVNSDAASGQ